MRGSFEDIFADTERSQKLLSNGSHRDLEETSPTGFSLLILNKKHGLEYRNDSDLFKSGGEALD